MKRSHWFSEFPAMLLAVMLFSLSMVLVQLDLDNQSDTHELHDGKIGEFNMNISLTGKNLLGQEASPYLLQHADNPVWWRPWGNAAFQAAEKEQKPIFLSIGYSTCHWCHVMENEVFEHEDVAEILNSAFISIKVDREEHPEVDEIYMKALLSMRGNGGWPLNLILTSSREPFWGATYVPREQFKSILRNISNQWGVNRKDIESVGKELTSHISRNESSGGAVSSLDPTVFKTAFRSLQASFDSQFGGFGRSPKFPQAQALGFLLRYSLRSGDSDAAQMVSSSLDAMASGGLRDHLAGGFHRYARDRAWKVPHFEKMLYDNALLSSVYLEGYQFFQKNEYLAIARETLDFVLSDMESPDGGYYTAFDADTAGEEGLFYVWSISDLKKVLTPPEFEIFKKVFEISHEGNFENSTNVLGLRSPDLIVTGLQNEVQNILRKLQKERAKRSVPFLDKKIITGWNGLMISAMATGYQVSGDVRYLESGKKAAERLMENTGSGGALVRSVIGTNTGPMAVLEDYVYLISGLLDLYESDFNPVWAEKALLLQREQDRLFLNQSGKSYSSGSHNREDLLFQTVDFGDSVLPAPNSLSVLNLLRLHALTFDMALLDRARQVISSFPENSGPGALSYSQALSSLDYDMDFSKKIAIIGRENSEETKSILSYVRGSFFPNVTIALGDGKRDTGQIVSLEGRSSINGQTTVFVCEGLSCKYPTNDIEKIKELINARKALL